MVEVEPETCSECTISSEISTQPVQVPFNVVARLVVYNSDIHRDVKGSKVTDLGFLHGLVDLLNSDDFHGYGAVIDTVDSAITFPVFTLVSMLLNQKQE